MIKTLLIVTLTAVGQPPATYRAEFDKMINCLGVRSDALMAYEKVYGFGIYPRSSNSDAMPGNESHVQIRAECITPGKDLLHSNRDIPY
jgi:hypothetical protein